MPADSVQWLLRLRFESASRQDVCFAAMDSANARFHTAFDKSYKRLYQMTQHAAQVMDGLLALITGDTVACDAFDVSPYVLSIIPEPVDYFSSCVLTDDCAGRCYDEFAAFEEERAAREGAFVQGEQLGVDTQLDVPLESLLFSLDDIEKGRHKPPFQILDAVEIPAEACAVVCNQGAGAGVRNRCLFVAGVRAQERELAVAYYCLPIDITQYVFQWPGMEAATQPAAGSARGFAAFADTDTTLRAVYAASSWAARFGARDSVVAVVDEKDGSQADANFASTPAQVTRVFWCAPGLPRREILRTALLSERRAGAARTSLLTKNYLYSLEHAQVTSRTTRRRTWRCACTATTWRRCRWPTNRATCCGGRSLSLCACSARLRATPPCSRRRRARRARRTSARAGWSSSNSTCARACAATRRRAALTARRTLRARSRWRCRRSAARRGASSRRPRARRRRSRSRARSGRWTSARARSTCCRTARRTACTWTCRSRRTRA
jgi:hypothetical protein